MRFHIPDDLDSDVLPRLMIQRTNHLTEATLADHLQYLVSATKQRTVESSEYINLYVQENRLRDEIKYTRRGKGGRD